MNSTSKVLSLIERTNNLSAPLKVHTANTTTSSVSTNDHSPSRRVKKPQSLSISEPIPKSSLSKPQSSTKNLSQKGISEGLSRPSLEFVKNLNFALSDLYQNVETRAKTHKETAGQEQKILKYIKHLVEEHKKLVQHDQKPGKNEKFNLVEQNIKIFTQEAAEEICLLEKKCTELEEENKVLELIASSKIREEPKRERVVQETPIPPPRSVKEIFEVLKTEHSAKDKSEFKVLLKSKINSDYPSSIKNLVHSWSQHHSFDISTLSILSNLILKVEHKLQNHKSSKSESYSKLLTHRQKLENLLSHEKKI